MGTRAGLDLLARSHDGRVARGQGLRVPAHHSGVGEGAPPSRRRSARCGAGRPRTRPPGAEDISVYGDVARPLYLELRALGLTLSVRDDPDGGRLDYGISIDGLRSLSRSHADRVSCRVRDNEDGLVEVLLDRRDPDLDAIRKEGNCR